MNGAKLLYDYMKYAIDPSTGTYTLSNDPLRQTQTLSNYITNFTVDVSELVSKNRIRFSIAFKTKGGKEYNTNNTVLLRNKILDKTNGNPDDYFAESIADDAKREVTQMELPRLNFQCGQVRVCRVRLLLSLKKQTVLYRIKVPQCGPFSSIRLRMTAVLQTRI